MALSFPQQVGASGTRRGCSFSPHLNCFPDRGPGCTQGSAVVSGLLVLLRISKFLCVQGLPGLWAGRLAQTLSGLRSLAHTSARVLGLQESSVSMRRTFVQNWVA